MRESKLFENGGNYSADEIEWYQKMISEFDEQLKKS